MARLRRLRWRGISSVDHKQANLSTTCFESSRQQEKNSFLLRRYFEDIRDCHFSNWRRR